MILIDTFVWVEHLRHGLEQAADRLERDQVLGHPFVLGELALGGFASATLQLLSELPQASVATTDEVFKLIHDAKFAGRGVGYVDSHLLASARLSGNAGIWTRDKRLQAVAADLGVLAPIDVSPTA